MRITLRGAKRAPAIGNSATVDGPNGTSWTRRLFGWPGALIMLLAALAMGGLFFATRKPLLPVPLPSELDQLEPQLRGYILEQAQWVRKAPREGHRHATLGLAYAANGLWHEARQAFGNAARLTPSEPLALMYVGVANQELGHLEEALRVFRELTARFPSFAPGFYRLGDALLRAGAVAESEAVFQRLITLAPQEWRGFAGLGDARLRQGDNAGAAQWLEKAVQADPSAKNARHLLGTAYRGLGRTEEAQWELQLGLNAVVYPMPDAWSQTAPQHMKLLQDQIDMANHYSQSGQPNKAAELLEQALRYHPQNFALLNNLAIAYNRSGQPEKAPPLLQKILQSDDRHVPAYITLSFNCQMLGLNEEALAQAERAIALSPNTAQAHLAKANALLSMERDLEALAALESAFRCDPQNAEILVEMGDVCLHNLNRPLEALKHYKAATKLNPVLVPAQVRLAGLHMKSGATNEAAAVLKTLRRIAPQAPELVVLENRLRKAIK